MIKRQGSGRDSGGKSRFKYRERSADDVKKRAEQTGGRFDSIFQQGFDTFRPKEGENVLRILPPTWDDHEHYGYDIWVHSRIGSDNSDYLCLRKMNKGHCPICDAYEESKKAGETDEAKALQPNRKTVMWVIDRDAEGKELSPLLWSISWMADRDISSLCQDKRKGKVLLIDHPDDGYDVIIKRHGQGLKTRYTYSIDRDPSEIDKDTRAQDDVLDYITENPIPSVLLFRDEEYLEKVLAGGSAEKDEDLDEDKDDRRSRSRDDDEDEDKSSRRRRDDDDDDDRRSSRRSRDKDEDDEKDDDRSSRRRSRDDDDKDEDEDKPRGGGRRRERANDDDEKDDRSSRRSRDKDEDEDERSSRRSSRDKDEDRSSRRRRDDDDEDDDKSSRRSRAKDDDDDDDDDRPRRTRSRRDDDEKEDDKDNDRGSAKDDEDDDRPSRRRGRR